MLGKRRSAYPNAPADFRTHLAQSQTNRCLRTFRSDKARTSIGGPTYSISSVGLSYGARVGSSYTKFECVRGLQRPRPCSQWYHSYMQRLWWRTRDGRRQNFRDHSFIYKRLGFSTIVTIDWSHWYMPCLSGLGLSIDKLKYFWCYVSRLRSLQLWG